MHPRIARLLKKPSVLLTATWAVLAYGSRFIDIVSRIDFLKTHSGKFAEVLRFLLSPRGSELMFFLGLIAFFVAVVVAMNPGETAQPSKPQPSDGKSTAESDDTEYKQLKATAKQQAFHIDKWIWIKRTRVDYGNLTATIPYLDLYFDLYNSSVFPITIEESLHGDIYIDGYALSGSAKIRGSGLRNIQPGDERTLSITQWVNDSEAKVIMSGQITALRPSMLSVTVKGAETDSEIHEQRLFLPDIELIPHNLQIRERLELGISVAGCQLEDHITTVTPHVNFRFDLFNGSLSTVSVGQLIEGFVRYDGMELSRPLSLSNTWRLDEFRRYYHGRIDFCQRLTKEEADYILSDQNKHSHYFDFEHLKIMITAEGVAPRPLNVGRGIRLNNTLV